MAWNLFAAECARNSPNYSVQIYDLHEAAFIQKYTTRHVCDWFNGWSENLLSEIKQNELWHTGPLVKVHCSGKEKVTEECVDLIGLQEDDLLNGMDQKQVYKRLMHLSENDYVSTRRFLIENPVITESDLRRMKVENSDISDILSVLEIAYERVPSGSYTCPSCGWTLMFDGLQAFCCNSSCTAAKLVAERLSPISAVDHLRLKHGVMRYLSIPGQLELQIKAYAEKLGLQAELWPNKDQYDIGITFPGGDYWAVDAKTYRNPYQLRKAIFEDHDFYRAKWDRAYYVIPSNLLAAYPAYCDICNDRLRNMHSAIRCITDRKLKTLMKGGSINGTR